MAQLLSLIHGEEVTDGAFRSVLSDDRLIIYDEYSDAEGVLFREISIHDARARTIGNPGAHAALNEQLWKVIDGRAQRAADADHAEDAGSADVGRAADDSAKTRQPGGR